MPEEIGQTLLQRHKIFFVQVGLGNTAMVLKSTHGRDDNDGGGFEFRHTTLDVQKLFRSEVRSEARLGDRVVPQFEGHPGGNDGITAVGDVGERSAMDKSRRAFQCLNQIRFESIFEQGGHGTVGVQLTCGNWGFIPRVPNNDAGEAILQVIDILGKTKNCHDLGGRRGIETVFPRNALTRPPRPLVMLRSWRSFMSTARLQVMRRTSMFKAFP